MIAGLVSIRSRGCYSQITTKNKSTERRKINEIKRENGHLELIASQASHKSNEYTSVELFLAVHCMDMVNNFVFQFSIKLCIILKSKGYWLFVSHLILSMEREVHWSPSMPAPFFSALGSFSPDRTQFFLRIYFRSVKHKRLFR